MEQKNKRSILSLGKEILKQTPKRKKQAGKVSSDIESTSQSNIAIAGREAEAPITDASLHSRSPRRSPRNDGMELDPSPQNPGVVSDEEPSLLRVPEAAEEAEQEGSFPPKTILSEGMGDIKEY